MSRVQPPEKHTSSTGRHRGLRGCAGFRSSAGRAQSGAGRRGPRDLHDVTAPDVRLEERGPNTRGPARAPRLPARTFTLASSAPSAHAARPHVRVRVLRPARGPLAALRPRFGILMRYSTESGPSVDLIYLDPPFNSNRAYNVIYSGGGEEDRAQIEAFDDRK